MVGLFDTLEAFSTGLDKADIQSAPARLCFGLNTALAPLGSLHVQFARLELVMEGAYSNSICDGSANIVTNDLKAGEAIFVPADGWNKPNWDSDVVVLSLLFGATHLGASLMAWDASAGAFASVERTSCLIPSNGPLRHMVESLTDMSSVGETKAPHALLQCRALVAYCRQIIEQPIRGDDHQSSAFFRAARQYIDEHLDQTINRDMVAQHLEVSPSYFSKVFHEQGGMTFSEYVTRERIAKARYMLENYDLPLTQISKRCGFRDFNYFFKVFKKAMGCTPTEYRNSLQDH